MTSASVRVAVATAAVAALAGWAAPGGSGPPTPAPAVGPVAPRPAVAPSPVVPVVPVVGSARWRWPVAPRPPVLRPFRAPRSTYGAGHRGLDLAAAPEQHVLAVEGGVVTHAGVLAGRGTVTVQHRGGLRSTYEPLTVTVRRGQQVGPGQLLGRLQAVGDAEPDGDRASGAGHCGALGCLHLGAVTAAGYVDPYPLLAGGRLRLLPLGSR